MSFNVDDLYDELLEEYTPVQKESIADKIERVAEESFFSHSIEERDRVEEETRIKKEIVDLTRSLRRLKNSKNTRHRDINAARAKRRDTIRKQIALFKLRLTEIQDERQGAKISPSKAVSM